MKYTIQRLVSLTFEVERGSAEEAKAKVEAVTEKINSMTFEGCVDIFTDTILRCPKCDCLMDTPEEENKNLCQMCKAAE